MNIFILFRIMDAKYVYAGLEGRKDILAISLVFLGIFLLVALVGVIFRFVEKSQAKKNAREIRKNTLSVMHYIYDHTTENLTIFSANDSSEQKVTKLASFLRQLPTAEESSSVKQWLIDYATGKKSSHPFLTVHTSLAGNKKSDALSVLKMDEVNLEKQKVHFEIVTLPAIRVRKGALRTKTKGESSQVRKLDEIRSLVESKNKKARHFACYYITLTQYITGSSEVLNGKTLYVTNILQPINGIQKYLSRKSALVLENDRAAMIFDMRPTDSETITAMCNTILDEISRFFSVHGLSDMYQISIGVSKYDGTGKFDDAVARAKSLSESAQESEGTSYLIEGEADAENVHYDLTGKSELRLLLKNQTYRIFYVPVLSLNKGGSRQFLLDIRPYGIRKESFFDFLKTVQKQGAVLPFYKGVFLKMKRTLEQFPDAEVILPCLVTSSSQVQQALMQNAPELLPRTIFAFRATDVRDVLSARLDYRSYFEKIREDKLRIGLYFSDPGIPITPDVLQNFDLFLVDTNISEPLAYSQTKILVIRKILDSFSSYGKEIVINTLDSVPDIIYGSEIGVTTFTAPPLDGPSSIPYIDDSWKEALDRQGFDEENSGS